MLSYYKIMLSYYKSTGGVILEKWQILFMIGSGVYLLLLGVVMIKHKKISMRKGIGIYNIVIGLLSIVGGIAGNFIKNVGNKVFLGFTVVLIVSFIIFNVLNTIDKKTS